MHIYWALSALIISTLPTKTRQCHRFAVRDGMGRIYLFSFVLFLLCVCVFFFLCVVFADCYVSFLEEKRIILTKPIT